MLTNVPFAAYSTHALRARETELKHEIRGVDVLFCLPSGGYEQSVCQARGDKLADS